MRLVSLLVFLALAACGPSAGTPAGPMLDGLELTGIDHVAPGATEQLALAGLYADGSRADLTSVATWTSDPESIAMVDAGGVVTGQLTGHAMITATVGAKTATIAIDVTMGTATAVIVTPGQATLAKGQQRQLVATAMYSGGTMPEPADGVAWTSSDATVASVDDQGNVHTLAIGAATITASVENVTGTAAITVGPAELQAFVVEPDQPQLPLGLTLQLTATGTYTDATTVDPASVTWQSSNPNAATISTTGLVTPVALGTTTITARVGSVFATTDLTVTAASLVSIAVTSNPASVVPGRTIALVATGTLSDSTQVDLTQTATWTTGDANLATVSTTGTRGVVTGVAVGDVTITATDGTVHGGETVHVLGLALGPVFPDRVAGVRAATPITISFNQAVMQTSVTVQAGSGPCSGSIQLSSDNFTTCVGLGAPAFDATNQVVTVVPLAPLVPLATYEPRILGTVANAAGVAMGITVTRDAFEIATDGPCADAITISQVYGGGGNTGAPYDADFVELHNTGTSPAFLGHLSIQYASATGSTWSVVGLAGNLAPGAYWVVQMSTAGTVGAPLPADVPAVPAVSMAATAGKVALVDGTAPLTGSCPLASTLDFVGYGTTATCFEGSAPAPAPSSTLSVQRANAGCNDANQGSTDFVAAPVAPRPSATPAAVCSCVANETDAVAELDYCNLQFPATLAAAAGATTDIVYGQVYEAGLTEAAGASSAIRVDVGLGPAASDPRTATWTWTTAAYNLQSGNNDEYMTTLTAPATAGSYAYTTRATRDGTNWTYCDLDGAGSNAGLTFDPAQLGVLTAN